MLFRSTSMRWGVQGEGLMMYDGLSRGRVTAGGRNFPVPGGMLETAENLRRDYSIPRAEQDEFAVGSQNKAEAAQKAGKFRDEIVAVTVSSKKGDVVVSEDEYIRHGATFEGMQKLKPAFSKDGTVTAGNASGINDGAAALVIMTAKEAAKRGLSPLARVASWATAGVDPAIMGSGPIPASRKALEKAGWKIGDLDLKIGRAHV